MTDTNNTVLTDEEIRHKWEAHTPQLCHPGSLAHGFARAVERAVIAKLGQPAASEAGAVPVYYRYRHSVGEKWHYGPTPQSWWECQALYTAPPAQPEKQAAQDELQRLAQMADTALHQSANDMRNIMEDIAEALTRLSAAPPAPSQQAALGAEPLVGDAAQSLPERAAMIEAARHAGFQFWKMADGKYQLKPLVIGTAFAAPAAESAEPVTGGTVSELLDAIRHYGSEKWAEGNRHAIAVGDDRKSIRAAWDDVYRLVQLLAAQPTAATADAQGEADYPPEIWQADAQGDERAAFEAEWRGHTDLAKDQFVGVYTHPDTQKRWAGWLARAALSRQPSAPASAGDAVLFWWNGVDEPTSGDDETGEGWREPSFVRERDCAHTIPLCRAALAAAKQGDSNAQIHHPQQMARWHIRGRRRIPAHPGY